MRRPKNKRHKKKRGNQQQHQQQNQQKHDYSKIVTTFSVYVATWNVSTRYPDSITVHQLLGLGSTPDPKEDLPDFYVIG